MQVSKLSSLLLIVVLLFGTACKKEDPGITPASTPSTLEILTLGDSRVEGGGSHESYRYEFFKNLVEGNWDFDFIGNNTEERTFPAVNGRSFDRDHQGRGGEVTAGILNTLQNETFEKAPEIALVGIGGNDLVDLRLPVADVISNYRQIIAQLRTLNPNVIILIEQIAPGRSDFMTSALTTEFNNFNSEIATIGNELTTTASPVVVVNMFSGWSDDYMADEVHYNQAGAKIVADRYFQALQANVTR